MFGGVVVCEVCPFLRLTDVGSTEGVPLDPQGAPWRQKH